MERRVLGPGALGNRAGIAHWHMPLFESIRPEWSVPMDRSSRAGAERYLEMLTDGAATVTLLVTRLADPDVYPILIHCAAGRDRTGIVIALHAFSAGRRRRRHCRGYALSAALVTGDDLTAHPETMRLLLQFNESRARLGPGFLRGPRINETDLALFERHSPRGFGTHALRRRLPRRLPRGLLPPRAREKAKKAGTPASCQDEPRVARHAQEKTSVYGSASVVSRCDLRPVCFEHTRIASGAGNRESGVSPARSIPPTKRLTEDR